MRISRLSLTQFRNHAATSLTPGSGLVLLAGENGAGKTNILEAISLLSPGRGLRGAALPDMARGDGKAGFAISAECSGYDAQLPPITIGTGADATQPGRRKVRINGAEAAAASLKE